MALKGEAKKLWNRNYNRTKRYGKWRQIYYNAGGMCEQILDNGERCGMTDNLEIHEECDGIAVIKWKILCLPCHLEVEFDHNHLRRKYRSKLAEDISNEVKEYGGLKAWKRVFFIRENQTNE